MKAVLGTAYILRQDSGGHVEVLRQLRKPHWDTKGVFYSPRESSAGFGMLFAALKEAMNGRTKGGAYSWTPHITLSIPVLAPRSQLAGVDEEHLARESSFPNAMV